MEADQQNRNLAMVVHGLVALTGLSSVLPILGYIGLLASIATVVLYFVWKSKGEFVTRHAKQAAGLQVVLFLVGLLLSVIVGGAVATTAMAGGFGAALAIGGFLALVGWIIGLIALILGIMGLMSAQKGQPYTYPLIGRYIDNLRI